MHALAGGPQLDLDPRLLALLLGLGQPQPAFAAGEERRRDLVEVPLDGRERLGEARLDRLASGRRGASRAPSRLASRSARCTESSSSRSFSASYSSLASGLTWPSCSRRRSSRSSFSASSSRSSPSAGSAPAASSRRRASSRSASVRASSTSIAASRSPAARGLAQLDLLARRAAAARRPSSRRARRLLPRPAARSGASNRSTSTVERRSSRLGTARAAARARARSVAAHDAGSASASARAAARCPLGRAPRPPCAASARVREVLGLDAQGGRRPRPARRVRPSGATLGGEGARLGLARPRGEARPRAPRARASSLGEPRRALGERLLEPGAAAAADAQGLVEPLGARDEPLEPRRVGAAHAAQVRDRRERGRSGPRARSAQMRRAAASAAPPVRARSTSAASSRRRASSSSSTASAVSPANQSSPRCRIPADAVLGHRRRPARRAAPRGATTGRLDELARIAADEHDERAEPGGARALDELEPALGSSASTADGAMAERGGDGALRARLDLEQLQRELLALLGERARGGRKPFALGERLLERGEPLAARARRAPPDRRARAAAARAARVGLVGGTAELVGRRARVGARARLGQLARAARRAAAGRTRGAAGAAAPRRGARAARRGRRRSASTRPRRGGRAPASRLGREARRLRGRARRAATRAQRSSASTWQARALGRSRLRGAQPPAGPPPRARRRARDRGRARPRARRAATPRSDGGRLAPQARAARRRSAGGRARRSPARARPRRRSAPPRPRSRSATSCSRSSRRARGARSALARAAAHRPRRAAPRAARGRASRSPPGAARSPRASFSARSAAVACSASGRRRLRTSSSRSRARSTCIATRASFSSARWRRSLKRPRPAASSTSSRRSDGFELSTVSTLPCEITERRPPPSPTSESSSTRSMRRTAARLTRYWPSPPRCSRRATRDLGERQLGPGAVVVVEERARPRSGRPACGPPSRRRGRRRASRRAARCGLSEPVAQRIESETFDLPEPFGPTTTATPGSRRTSTGSTNDLKPRSLTAFRCTRREASERPRTPPPRSPGRSVACRRRPAARTARRSRPGPRTRASASSTSAQAASRSGLGEPGEHLVERAERLALELRALRRRRQPERRLDAAHLDLA